MLKYEDKYCLVYFDEAEAAYEQCWYSETQNLSDKSFKGIIRNVSSLIHGEKRKAIKSLLDTRDFLFSILPELQLWHADFVASKMSSYVTNSELNRTAALLSSNFISQLSIKQAMDENKSANNYGATHYFSYLEKARTWLMAT